jgi:large subunit ribosomal protein L19
MDKKIIEFNKSQRTKNVLYQAGDVVKIHLKIKEGGKERVQVFEGLIIAVKGGQSSSPTITVRKVSHGVGVEMILPVLSKNIEKITLVKKAKVRRAKLYYVRSLTAKKSRMKYKDIKDFMGVEEEKVEEKVEEEIKEESKEEKNEEKK